MGVFFFLAYALSLCGRSVSISTDMIWSGDEYFSSLQNAIQGLLSNPGTHSHKGYHLYMAINICLGGS